MKKKKYEKPVIIPHYILLEGAITNCSACIVPEGTSNDILIQDYDGNTEIEDLYF